MIRGDTLCANRDGPTSGLDSNFPFGGFALQRRALSAVAAVARPSRKRFKDGPPTHSSLRLYATVEGGP